MKDKKPVNISPESDLTPISNTPIKKVNKNSWNKITNQELVEQLTVLQNRYIIALELKKPEMANQIQKGIDELQSVVNARFKF